MKRLVRVVDMDNRDEQYRLYLDTHISNVKGVWYDILRPEVQSELDNSTLELIDKLIQEHDLSKYSQEEWGGYLDHFYPDDTNPKSQKELDLNYKYAWLHHSHNNPHHWNHWLLIDDDMKGKLEPIDMPIEHVMCMLSDWGSFRYGQKTAAKVEYPTTIGWYEDNKKNFVMTDGTIKLINKYIKYLP